jgi:DNA ligase (NAD+)
MNANEEMLTAVDEIGDKMAESLVSFFKEEHNRQLIEKFRAAGLNFNYISNEVEGNKIFEGMTFVLTGTLSKYTRNEAQELVEKFGGKVSSSVSKKTTYVLAGEEAGSKLKKAQDLGISIITEDDFEKMLEGEN